MLCRPFKAASSSVKQIGIFICYFWAKKAKEVKNDLVISLCHMRVKLIAPNRRDLMVSLALHYKDIIVVQIF